MSKLDIMNRFSVNPVSLDKKRSRFKMGNEVKTTFVAGKLIPVGEPIEVLPGDTMSLDISSVVRSITPAVPVMDNSFIDVFAFFVPNRIACAHPTDWQKICGENFDGFWAPQSESTLQNTGNTIKLNDIYYQSDDNKYEISPSSIAGYMGLPIGKIDNLYTGDIGQSRISSLPFNGYIKIFNEWFRDQNTQAPLDISDFNDQFGEPNNTLWVNKFHDYFTSALPSPQRGESVLLPLGSLAPVIASGDSLHSMNGEALLGFSASQFTYPIGVHDEGGYTHYIAGAPTEYNVSKSNLYADLSNATASTVNQLRQAFAVQRLLERSARGGSRFREYLKSAFGVSIPDATIQIPEYLGGKRVPLNINQVLQTAPTDSTDLGTTGAFSNTAFADKLFVKSFNEHGYIHVLTCVRNSQSYSQGISRTWTRDRLYDWYDPIFANLGEQPVYKKELFIDNSVEQKTVFGYQEAWADYRFRPNKVTGELAPGANNPILTAWTYTSKFTQAPVLNSAFMKQPREQIDDTLVVQNASYQFIADFYLDLTATRVMPLYSIPGLIDHH